MIYDLAITGKIVSTEEVEESTICIKDGKVASITEEAEAKRSIRLTDSSLIFPGFIDAHVHLREDQSQQWSYKEDFITGSKAAVHGGISVIADMPNTPEPAINRQRVLQKRELAKKSPLTILFYGSVLSGNLDKLKEIADLVYGYKIFIGETTGKNTLEKEKIEEAIKTISETNKPIIFHCEYGLEKLLELCKKHNAKTHIAHVARKDEIEIIKKYKNKMQLTCETCPHYLFFTEKDSKIVKPVLGTEQDKTKLIEALKNGTIDMLSSDHAPHTLEDKEKGAFGFPGLDTYANIVSWLLVNQKIKPEQIVKLTSENPAKHLSIATGIKQGLAANLTILDMQKTVVRKQDLQTKSAWSPFEGYEFPGRAVYTIHNGKILMDNGKIEF